jgi:hypothetical protein
MDNTENIFFLLNDNPEIIDNTIVMQDLLDEYNTNTENKLCEEQFIRTSISSKSFKEYNINELLKICDYYGLIKYVKMAKYKKNDIIQSILLFESDEHNNEIVQRRYTMWHYMSELTKDSCMKKYIIWK